ncbi:MAG: 2-amino-4-hydroxy-6-hydroxymethyldihydropteridine diphosphokinase [Candidatus Omnitrophota bacterium]
MTAAYIALGSNLGDRNKNIERSVNFLKELSGITVKRMSSVYETDSEGGPPQDKFLNGVLEIETTLLPDELLDRLKGIESRMGRSSEDEPNSPRPIDLDILLYADIVISGGRMKIPHPKMHQRLFVLKGLCEIAPDVLHPKLRKTSKELYDDLVAVNEGRSGESNQVS